LAPNAIKNTLLSLGLAYVVLLFATMNWILASLAIANVSFIVITIFGAWVRSPPRRVLDRRGIGFLHVAGWGLGVLESILCVLVVGFSIDFTVHLVDTYGESHHGDRFQRTKEALSTTGPRGLVLRASGA
jgi:hypothetical protein